jgi:hypothetical protein
MTSELNLAEFYYDQGYANQIGRYPLLDHVWGNKKYFWQKARYPKKYQKFYQLGQIKAYRDNKAERPWFI